MNINFIHGTINNELISLNSELANTYHKVRNYLIDNIEIDIYMKDLLV